MSQTYSTDQEAFWSGDFGDSYVDRNADQAVLASRTHMISNCLKSCGPVSSVVEFGANIGLNMIAFERLVPGIERTAIEINAKAVEQLQSIPGLTVHHGTILKPQVKAPVDMAFISGVLIHVNPDALTAVYDNLHAASRRYIVLAEYYNPSPVEISYRGHSGRLFKRDFAGEMLDRFSDLRLRDYGFQYHRDTIFPADDVTWFVLEKSA